MSVNQIYLLGRCGKDAEVRTAGQSKVATFSLATGGKYKTKDGREVDDTAWHNIVAWRNLADLAEKCIKKGSQLFVVGHLTYRDWTDNNGVKRVVAEIVADKIELLGGKAESSPAPQKFDPHAVKSSPIVDDLPPDDDGLPFN